MANYADMYKDAVRKAGSTPSQRKQSTKKNQVKKINPSTPSQPLFDPWASNSLLYLPESKVTQKPVIKEPPADRSHKVVPVFDKDAELKGSEYTSQMEALYYLLRGDNVVLCGQAGAGKSWVIDTFREIVRWFNGKALMSNKEFNLAVTASTGIAASLIMGRTIHSWSGLGVSVDKFDPSELKGSARASWIAAKKRISKTTCLIVDEVSMLPSYFLTNLDLVCRHAKKNLKEPFGGLQIVLVGDFLQLPPVDTKTRDKTGKIVDASYCFNAHTEDGKSIFGISKFKWCYLDKVRRSKDPRLTNLLNHIRTQQVSDEDLANLRSRFVAEKDKDKVYTQLRTTNMSVDKFNNAKLERLRTQPFTYKVSWGGDSRVAHEMIKQGKLYDVTLKKGAIVMVTSNSAVPDDNNCMNGSMGVIMSCNEDEVQVRLNTGAIHTISKIAIQKKEYIPKIEYDEYGTEIVTEVEKTIASVYYMPLKLAWAITVHKSQGQTLDGAEIDMSRCFQKGLGYVALSRCSSMDDIIMKGSYEQLPENALLLDDDALRADNRIRHHAKKTREELLENEEEVNDLEVAYKAASSKSAKTRIRKQINALNPLSILDNDRTVYDWLYKNRARKIPKNRERKTLDF